MTSGWTPERRKKQAELIWNWQPWKHSTGPKTAAGKNTISRNADKGKDWLLRRQIVQVLGKQDKYMKEYLVRKPSKGSHVS